MGKRGRTQKRNPKRRSKEEYVDPEDMDDEIDAFHKQRDIVPLDVTGDVGDSDEDDEEPVFHDEDIDDDEDDDDDEEEEHGLAAKITRQQKYLQAKFGGVDDEMHVEDEEEEQEKRRGWGGKKPRYYGGDNRDFELKSSDDEAPKEEEEEILRLQREKAKSLSMEDFGLDDVDEDDSDRELTLEEISVKGKERVKAPLKEAAVDDTDANFEEVKKDLNALSREEQMDVVYSSAPELVGLLSELNVALDELESKVNPLLSKVKLSGVKLEGGTRYLEVKQLLLLAYCQAITFYLLLKSEGHSVRDHPVIARLVEIKGLLDKTKELDQNLPSDLEEFLRKNCGAETVGNPVTRDTAPSLLSGSVRNALESSVFSHDAQEVVQPNDMNELVNQNSFHNNDNKEQKHKHKNDQIGLQSMEMLKVRAALEEKLKQKGILSSLTPKADKSQKNLKLVNRQLATYDDFDDDAVVIEKGNGGLSNGSLTSIKPSQLVPTKLNKPKVISGDDDLPKRDDIGERRRKHELRVLAGAGIKSQDDAGIEPGPSNGSEEMGDDSDRGESEDDFYTQVKQKRDAKLSAKAEIYKRAVTVPSLPETVDGKRLINHQIEKNRGLTRQRNKLTKNPRKKYRTKHDKAQTRRKGQVRDIKKPRGPYGGESSGINAGISRSIRF